MTLFDDVARHDEGPAQYAEARYSYLNRSARADVAKVRETLEEWFRRYPDEAKSELRGNFRSPNDYQHLSAFFELFLHELLLRVGCRVEIHPKASDAKTTRPDFRVESPSGNHLYMEAVLATDESQEEAAARARLNDLYDALDRMDSPNFFIGIELKGEPKTPLPAGKIRSFLSGHLAPLNPDEIARVLESGGLRALPHWSYEHEGCVLTFFPVPKSQELRGREGIRPIGIQMDGPHWIQPRDAIRDAVVTKAGRYGVLDLPYVIAVNALGEHVSRTDIMEALFGKEQFTIRSTPSGPSKPKMTRILDGAWTSESGPRYTRVSAALMAIQLLPWSVPRTSVCLYHNPWAKRSYQGELCRLSRAVPNREKARMERVDGESLSRIFDLAPDWPSN